MICVPWKAMQYAGQKLLGFLLRGVMFAHPLATDLSNAFDHSSMALYSRDKQPYLGI